MTARVCSRFANQCSLRHSSRTPVEVFNETFWLARLDQAQRHAVAGDRPLDLDRHRLVGGVVHDRQTLDHAGLDVAVRPQLVTKRACAHALHGQGPTFRQAPLDP